MKRYKHLELVGAHSGGVVIRTTDSHTANAMIQEVERFVGTKIKVTNLGSNGWSWARRSRQRDLHPLMWDCWSAMATEKRWRSRPISTSSV